MILQIIALTLLNLFTFNTIKNKKEYEVIKARITYYSNDSKWGNKVAWSKVKKAKEGVTIAAHPDFDFGTEIEIPELKGKIGDGKFIVQDRGPAVTRKKASKGKGYVFDIYVSNHSKIRKNSHRNSEWMIVKLKKKK